MKTENLLPDASFLVLAVLAEGRSHGYELQRIAHDRGFQFWTRLKRSSIYQALEALEREQLIRSTMETGGGGPARKVYEICRKGLRRLERDAVRHLSRPSHPRSEIDLGIYALPSIPPEERAKTLRDGLAFLREREEFLRERHAWCLDRKLELPALAFERPLLCLQAEIQWLERVAASLSALPQGASAGGWDRYEFRQPGSNHDD